jgi:hypothetical protein
LKSDAVDLERGNAGKPKIVFFPYIKGYVRVDNFARVIFLWAEINLVDLVV